MKIFVKVRPGAKVEKVEEVDATHFVRALGGRAEGYLVVAVREEAREGKVNKRLIEILSQYLGISKSSVRIIAGLTSREKVVEVM